MTSTFDHKPMTILRAATAAVALGTAVASASGEPQQDLRAIAGEILHQKMPGDTAKLSSSEIARGLKEALTKGADAAARRLSARDGYFGDAAVRIPLPGALGQAQKKLRPFGISGPLDDLQLRINRAAESAAPTARKLAVSAISSMTIDDALGVLRGGDHSATDFLRKRTEAGLTKAFRPYFQDALDKAGAVKAAEKVAGRYGAGDINADVRTWLVDQAVVGAVNGVFYYVGEEERAIRTNPAQQTTELLKRVFGG